MGCGRWGYIQAPELDKNLDRDTTTVLKRLHTHTTPHRIMLVSAEAMATLFAFVCVERPFICLAWRASWTFPLSSSSSSSWCLTNRAFDCAASVGSSHAIENGTNRRRLRCRGGATMHDAGEMIVRATRTASVTTASANADDAFDDDGRIARANAIDVGWPAKLSRRHEAHQRMLENRSSAAIRLRCPKRKQLQRRKMTMQRGWLPFS